MKKFLAFLLVIGVVSAFIGGCSGGGDEGANATDTNTAANTNSN